jgi:uncharacterized protein YlxW (UPF0749 family)
MHDKIKGVSMRNLRIIPSVREMSKLLNELWQAGAKAVTGGDEYIIASRDAFSQVLA